MKTSFGGLFEPLAITDGPFLELERERRRRELRFQRHVSRSITRAYHGRIEENNVDPDDGNSWLCSACNLPIFSTPYTTTTNTDHDDGSSKVLFLHDRCAHLPKELTGSVLHPRETLFLQDNQTMHPAQTSTTHHCVKCNAICGTKFYYCRDPNCDFQLDVLCALKSIEIVHRSHQHRLMAIRAGSASFICGACGTQHQARPDLSYLCSPCGFWIHPHCASLPNIILLHHANHHHQHPLLLIYRLSESIDQDTCHCAICKGLIETLGVYSCINCRDYYVHIMCAVSDPQSFTPVLIREAQLRGVVHLPIPDEHTSMIRYIRDITSVGGTSSSDHHGELPQSRLHEHRLILHDRDDINCDHDHDHHPRVCNGCVQFIISPPFYSCSECPDFFLHDCCAHLPLTLTQHPAHKRHPLFLFPKVSAHKQHPLSLVPKASAHKQHPLSLFPKASSALFTFNCDCCSRPCNGFSYPCMDCGFRMDVLCAIMPILITHDAHENAHLLYSSFIEIDCRVLKADRDKMKKCNCCGKIPEGPCYECRTCRNFKLHARCAQLPNTVCHKFDPHPLKLITTSKWSESSSDHESTVYSTQNLKQICEICERDIENMTWYYSCDECDQSFHTDCIPCLDSLSRIKFGVTINVQCHKCPLTLIRAHTVCGYRCGYCGEAFTDHHELAFECSKCCFRIHKECAEKCLLKN